MTTKNQESIADNVHLSVGYHMVSIAMIARTRKSKSRLIIVSEPVYNLKLLARAIAKAFNAPEFEELLLAIEVDSADISGDSMKAKAISLVQLCRRHNKLKELVKECRSERPKVDWNVEKK